MNDAPDAAAAAPRLLTPGPLTTAAATRAAMERDWGSRDAAFIALTARVRRRLLALANASDSHVAIPLQGSGTFIVEAALGTLVPRDGRTLALVNGAYGRRMAAILARINRDCVTLECPEEEPVDPAALAACVAQDPAIACVAAVHCETTTGIVNPLEEIAATTAAAGRTLLLDAMSSFGALDIDLGAVPVAALMASSNKCLEGVPGLGFALVRRDLIEAAAGTAHSVSLDLHAQWKGLEANGQWRFTPPTHVVAALDAALDGLDAEGGVPGRRARYAENRRVLVEGMAGLGFETLLQDDVQSPIIVTFRAPADPAWDFATFYAGLSDRGFAIYPGKLAAAESFRIGCIGAVTPADMAHAVEAVAATMRDMGLQSGRPDSFAEPEKIGTRS